MNPLLGARVREVVLHLFENPGISRGHIHIIFQYPFRFSSVLRIVLS